MKTTLQRTFCALLVLFYFFGLAGQQKDKDSFKFFCPNHNFKSIGFYAGLGASNSIASTASSQLDLDVTETTGYKVTLTPKGQWGQSLEVGAFFIPHTGLIRLVDFGVGFRNFRGVERIEAVRDPGGDVSFPDDIISQGEFNYTRISLRTNIQTVTLLGKRAFFHQGPGVFFDKTVTLNDDFDIPHLGLTDSAPRQTMIISLNYTAGIGFKLKEGQYLDFYAHAPLVSTGGKIKGGSELIYSSSYRNYVIGIRYQWLKTPPDRICPAFNGGSNSRKSHSKKSESIFKHW